MTRWQWRDPDNIVHVLQKTWSTKSPAVTECFQIAHEKPWRALLAGLVTTCIVCAAKVDYAG